MVETLDSDGLPVEAGKVYSTSSDTRYVHPWMFSNIPKGHWVVKGRGRSGSVEVENVDTKITKYFSRRQMSRMCLYED